MFEGVCWDVRSRYDRKRRIQKEPQGKGFEAAAGKEKVILTFLSDDHRHVRNWCRLWNFADEGRRAEA